MAYSATNSLWQLVAVYALLGLALSLCGLVSNMVMLTGWFDSGAAAPRAYFDGIQPRRRAVSPAVGSGIEQLGWRQTVLLTGVGVGSIMLGSVWLLLRDGRRVMPDSPPQTPHRPGAACHPNPLDAPLCCDRLCHRQPVVHYHRTTQHQSIHLARDVGLARSSLPSVFSLFFGCWWWVNSALGCCLTASTFIESWQVQY